jgi:hypothetical protein
MLSKAIKIFNSARYTPLVTTLAMLSIVLTTLTSQAQLLPAETLLKNDLQISVKTLKKDIYIYHYFNLSEFWPQLQTADGRTEYLTNYLQVSAGHFWDTNYSRSDYVNAGPGIYFAIDPHISTSFGNTAMELTVPAGSIYITTVEPTVIQKETIAALISEGYLSKELSVEIFKNSGGKRNGFYRDTLKKSIQPEFNLFRQLLQKIFSDLNIQLVEYNWDTSIEGFCSGHSYSAFVFIGRADPSSSTRSIVDETYTKPILISSFETPNLTDTEKDRIDQIVKLRQVLDQISDLKKLGKKIPKELITKIYTNDELKNVKDHIYSCEK